MSTLIIPYVDVTVNAKWNDWQNYPKGRPNPDYSKQTKDWNIDGLIFAFITLSVGKNPCWAAIDAMPIEWALPLATELKEHGKKVIISFGGAANADISTKYSVDQLTQTYNNFIIKYNADGLDFDLENRLYNANNICAALKEVQTAHPKVKISFTLPVMPYGLVQEGVSIITTAKNYGIDFAINGMAMDYGNGRYPDRGQAAIDAATAIEKQLSDLYKTSASMYSRVAITPMIGLNDDRGMFTLEDADKIAQFARANNFAFLSSWSFNRDNPSSCQYPNATTSSNPQQKVPGEYSQHLACVSQ